VDRAVFGLEQRVLLRVVAINHHDACGRGGCVNSVPSETVPRALKPVYEQIVGITNAFCERHLDGDYASLCMKMAASLARKRPSPLTKGQTRSWAGRLFTLSVV
jgi:Domain of unknown function (DUF6398)